MVSGQDTRPPSFHYEYSDDWATWVLDHGLPALPDVLGDDDEVPIAYWAGQDLGAVLFRSWWWDPEEDDANPHVEVNDDHYSYVRTKGGWEPTGASGGSGGPEDDPMRTRPLPDRLAHLGGEWHEGGPPGAVRGVTALVGSAARTIELTDRHGRTRRQVEAPLGWVIVCFHPSDHVTIRVLDADDQPLLEAERPPLPY